MAAIEIVDLVRHFGDVKALDGLNLEVEEGHVHGLLGPNGAGKTTAVRILATLLGPTAGSAHVMGHDVVADAHAVRSVIGLTGQSASVDEWLTGRENLVLLGRLQGIDEATARHRAGDLLDRFDLAEAADRPANTYSGGMQRRLDLAASLIGNPPVLFLDEPTTGLDPRSRLQMWSVIRTLGVEGVTVLLTTQYLEEADQLCDQIVVIDHGRAIARGTADELKDQVGGQVVEVRVHDPATLGQVAEVVAAVTGEEAVTDTTLRLVTSATSEGLKSVESVARRLKSREVSVADLSLRRPSLDEVFLQLTGEHIVEDDAEEVLA
ncbi:MAG: ATP-binding cassette domain-containing protein [Nitriliruptorales bacterium]|nr:ATP-binding cassette domain-containing protein [Nitriliruptorales bacterium]